MDCLKHVLLRDALPYKNAFFIIKFIKEGGRVKPVYKNLNLVCYEKKRKKPKKAKNVKKTEKNKKGRKKAHITL